MRCSDEKLKKLIKFIKNAGNFSSFLPILKESSEILRVLKFFHENLTFVNFFALSFEHIKIFFKFLFWIFFKIELFVRMSEIFLQNFKFFQ